MKKIIFMMLVALVSSMAITSCTEDEIQPSNLDGPGGTGGTGSF